MGFTGGSPLMGTQVPPPLPPEPEPLTQVYEPDFRVHTPPPLTQASQAPEPPLKFALQDAAWVIFGGGAASATVETTSANQGRDRRDMATRSEKNAVPSETS
jgi:hypothetical protein